MSYNAKDSVKHGTHVSIRRGEKSTNHKLTEQNVRTIIYMYRTGLFTQQEIADIYSVQQPTIYKIMNKKTWGHIWR